MTTLLFVCLGNICRSPTGEGVMRSLVRAAGLEHEIDVDSAGTGSWHVGAPPDPRSTRAAERRGIRLQGAARQLTREDLDRFDLVLCADAANVRDVMDLVGTDADRRAKVHLLREFDPVAVAAGDLDVPDPYTGGPEGFDIVLDQVIAACEGVLANVRAGTRPSQ